MSLPNFSTQAELFSTAGLSASLFAKTDRYRLFAKLVYPRLAAARAALAACYCSDNGRVALEPVLLLGTSILQYLDGIPDRQAVELLRYHAGWNFALNRQLGDEVFHPSSLVNFRNRLEEHQQSTLGFTIILTALEEAGLVSRQSRQRLDSTQIFGRVARMSRLDCVRESLRLALKELEGSLTPEKRPLCWLGLWERYVESQTDYRAGSETLARKLAEAGTDAWQLLEWLRGPVRSELAAGPQAQLLARVFAEQFELQAGGAVPAPKEKVVQPEANPTPVPAVTSNPIVPPKGEELPVAGLAQTVPREPQPARAPNREGAATGQPAEGQTELSGTMVQPKDKKQLVSGRVQNPHDPQATYSVKGQGEKKKEHVGYKVQVAETVCEVDLAPGEPTRNFITGLVTHAAHESDEAGALKMEAEQAAMGLDKPPVQYVDGAYVSAQQLAAAKAEGRELIGPAPGAPDNNHGRFTTEKFEVSVEQRTAVCPAGHQSTQCSRLEEAQSGKVNYRFEWSTRCAQCALSQHCVGAKQKHRTIVVGEYHSALQTRRREQDSDGFKHRMKHRNAIEGTQSELVRGHGLRHARYRGLGKAKLQSYFIGAACNVKRWIRREAWKLRLTALAGAAQITSVPMS
jgi:transposase